MPLPQRRSGGDACPGAVDVHRAADGGLARVRLPGGVLTGAGLTALADAADELGDGVLELTSRANVQVRGLRPGTETELGERLAAVGLLPSRTHEKVRNILASPLGPRTATTLDAALCARPELAGLSGRFLFALDDGRGDVAWLGADVAALPVGDTVAVLLAGRDFGIRVTGDPIPVMLLAADEFLHRRGDEWRLGELGDVAEIARALGGSGDGDLAGSPPVVGPIGPVTADGKPAVGAAVPLGRLTTEQARAVSTDEVVVTPWRGLVVPGGSADALASVGLLVDPDAPGVGVTACTGRPGCAKALADVRADALTSGIGGPAHWSGCGRRCGRPAGDVLDVVATTEGYLVDGELMTWERR